MYVNWLHAPAHAGSVDQKVIAFAVKQDPTVIDWSEMYWDNDTLDVFAPDYHHFIGTEGRTDSRGRVPNHDVVISVRKDAKVLHQEEFFVCGAVKSLIKYMPERHGKAVVFEIRGQRVLGVFWHPHPNPLRRLGLVFPKYKRSVERIEKVQKDLELQFAPDLVLNGGDLQLEPGNKWIHPNQLAKRLNMVFARNKIDWQLWRGPKYRWAGFKLANPAKANRGMDHMWMLLKLHINSKDL